MRPSGGTLQVTPPLTSFAAGLATHSHSTMGNYNFPGNWYTLHRYRICHSGCKRFGACLFTVFARKPRS